MGMGTGVARGLRQVALMTDILYPDIQTPVLGAAKVGGRQQPVFQEAA